MKEIKAIIVDDEKRSRNVLRNLLDMSSHNIMVVAESSELLDAVVQISKHKPQVVFLDVQMPNYAGYEIVNFIDSIDFEIIFITAFGQYAIKAFELCAIDYLVKPIDRNRLKLALDKLDKKLSTIDKLEDYKLLLNTIKSNAIDKIIIPELGNRRIINKSEVITLEADGAYTVIYLKDGNKITTSKNLKYFENNLKEDQYFFRSHRSWLININFLSSFNRTDNLLYLKNGITAKISRSMYTTFDEIFNEN